MSNRDPNKLGRPATSRSLSAQLFETTPTDLYVRSRGEGGSSAEQRTEVVMVMVAHQPFALLMTQVYNIVRPQSGTIRVLRPPDPRGGRLWGEIVYQEGQLRVLELARMLDLPLVEPIDRSKILLTGKLLENGSLYEPYGIAVDDVLGVQMLNVKDLRLLPAWLCHKRLGKLVWAAALVDNARLNLQLSSRDLQVSSPLTPLQLNDFMAEAARFDSELPFGPFDPNGLLPRPLEALKTVTATAAPAPEETKPGSSSSLFKPAAAVERPVMLLDISVLKKFAYSE